MITEYKVPSKSRYDVVVGWDPPLRTFFVKVYDLSIDDADEQFIVWEGSDPIHPIQDIERIKRIIYPYTNPPYLPPDIEKNLLLVSQAIA